MFKDETNFHISILFAHIVTFEDVLHIVLSSRNPSFSADSLVDFTNLVSFNASGFSLHGSIPNWFGLHLQSLQFLDLRCCEITGGIPFSVGNLSNLSELYLSDNRFTGTIPSSLGLLSRLSVLDLSRNALTGFIPSCLGSLGNMYLLDVSSNYLSGAIPDNFGKLLNIRFLNLSSNSFSGQVPTEFGRLRYLQRMVISNNNFTDDLPDALWSLPGLNFLVTSDNSFTGSLPNISCTANVTKAVFNLSHNMFYYGVLKSILRRVSFVDLSYNYIQGKIPDYAQNVAILDTNCFRSWSSQMILKECKSCYSKKGLPFDSFGIPVVILPLTLHDHKSKRRVPVLAAILGSLGLVLLLVILVILLIICSCKKSQTETRVGPISTERENLNLSCIGEKFAYDKIVAGRNGSS